MSKDLPEPEKLADSWIPRLQDKADANNQMHTLYKAWHGQEMKRFNAVLADKCDELDKAFAENESLREALENIYECRLEPDKMLTLVERAKQALKGDKK